MLSSLKKVIALTSLATISIAVLAVGTFAQDSQVRKLVNGKKYKIRGVIVAKDDSGFLLQDATGVSTKIVLTPNTSIKSSGFLGGSRYVATSLVRGLNLKTEGRGDGNGSLVAKKVRFSKKDLRTAQSIDSRVAPAEDRITKTEQNAERLSGQIDELMAISNAAEGGAKAAQETANAAVEGVNATNKRISDLDNFVTQSTSTVNFRVGSHRLSPEAKEALDNVATSALTLRGYLLEVTGYASSDGTAKANKRLSRRRAAAVIDYLVDTHDIPLRRIGTTYGYGENKAVADNTTLEGRKQNRRVEVKVLVSRGLNQNVEVRKATSKNDGTR